MRQFIKFWIFLLCGLSVLSCATVNTASSTSNQSARTVVPDSSSKAESFWNASPRGSDLVIIGIGGRKSSYEKEIEGALDDAARKVSIYNQVRGDLLYTERIGDGFFDYSVVSDKNLTYNENYQGYIEELRYNKDVDVLLTDNAIFVRTHWTSPSSIEVAFAPAKSGSRPFWIDSPPSTIGGLVTGVGYSAPRMYHYAYIASYEDAVCSIIKRVSNSANSSQIQYQGDGSYASYNKKDTSVAASGLIQGFYVLQIWVDPKDGGVYTFAVAQSAKPL
jgi:hypothetical protein